MNRADYREKLERALYDRQRYRNHTGVTGSAAADDTFQIIERQLRLEGIELDDAERRQMRWLCGGEISTLATITALILDQQPDQA